MLILLMIEKFLNNSFFGDIMPGQIVQSSNESELVILVDQNAINGSILNINANINPTSMAVTETAIVIRVA